VVSTLDPTLLVNVSVFWASLFRRLLGQILFLWVHSVYVSGSWECGESAVWKVEKGIGMIAREGKEVCGSRQKLRVTSSMSHQRIVSLLRDPESRVDKYGLVI